MEFDSSLIAQHKLAHDSYWLFWNDYLHDIDLFSFPSKAVIHHKKFSTIHCTNDMMQPEELVDNLKRLCTQHRLSMTESLGAAVIQTLRQQCMTETKNRSGCEVPYPVD